MLEKSYVKIILSIILILIVGATVTLAAENKVLSDNFSSNQLSDSDVISWTHTVGNGSNRMLVVGIGIKASSTMEMNIKSVKFGNKDMIYLNNSSVISGAEGRFNKTMLYYLPNPDSGNSKIIIKTADKCSEISAEATSLSNVYQGVPEAIATNTNTDNYTERITANIKTLTENAYIVSSVINSVDPVSLATTKMEDSGHNSVDWSSPKVSKVAISSAAFAPVTNNPEVSIVYDFKSTEQSFAVSKLERTLLELQYLPVKVDASESTGQENIIVKISTEESIQSEGFKISKNGKTYIIEAADESGAMYGLLEISDQILINGLDKVADRQVNPKFAFRAIKVNTPWSSYRYDKSLDQHYETMIDITYWESFLDMMATQRFNKLTLWNLHPFPYMIRSTNFPKATSFTDEELEKWKFLYQNIFRLAKERGIEVYLVNWNIFVSEEFKKNYDPDARTDMMGYNGEAYTTSQIEKYTKESVTQVLNEYPNLTGLGFTLGENMGGMAPEQREQWALNTIVAGMKEASRPARLIHRMPLSAGEESDAIANDVTTELITREALESITDIGLPIDTEIKFNGSHGYSSTKLHSTHGGSISDAYWNPAPTKYRIDWMIRNEDFYILSWAQPDFIREHIANNGQSYVGGYYIGSENYYPALNYIDKQTSSNNWINYGFQRQWMYYMTWGRLLYNPDTSDSIFETAINQRYGNNVGAKLLQAYKFASDYPHLFGAYTKTTFDFTSYSEGFLTPVPLSREVSDQRMSPFYSLEQLMKYPVTDPNYLSIKDYASYISNDKSVPDGKINPLQLANTLDKNAEEALKAIGGLSSSNPEFQQKLGDIQAWSYLSQYFADKLRSAVELVKYEAGHTSDKEQALAYIKSAKSHWESVIYVTENRYKAIRLTHLNWGPMQSRIPRYALYNNFSWKEFLPEVEWDITFVEEY